MNYRHFVHNYMLNPQHQLSVNVIGAGGTGSQVITSLGRMNYALIALGHPGLHVKVYDADIVTEANCGRQLFAPQEIGLNKADVLVTKLNMFFGTSWESRPVMYDRETKKANITISCVDTVKARMEIAKGFEDSRQKYRHQDTASSYYWLDLGNTLNTGQAVLGTTFEIEQPKRKRNCVKTLRCITDIFDLTKVNEGKSGPSCSLAEALTKQDLFINSTLANIGMAVLWKMFTKGVLETQGAYLNLETMKVNPIKIEKI